MDMNTFAQAPGAAEFVGLHFAEPGWFWLLLFFPLWWVGAQVIERIWPDKRKQQADKTQLRKYADPHLLPYLMVGDGEKAVKQEQARFQFKSLLPVFFGLSVLWLIVAMAGPRWDYQSQEVYRPDAAVMLVVDVSRSMLARDVSPSRMERARQELADFTDAAGKAGIRVGMIAFAAFPHIVSPLTEDMRTLRDYLPALTPELVAVQGSDPAEALVLAQRQLRHFATLRGGENLHIVLVSDGDLADAAEPLKEVTGQLANDPEAPIRLHVLALGTEEGEAIQEDGYYMRGPGGAPYVSKMDRALMEAITQPSGGGVVEGTLLRDDTETLMRYIQTSDMQSESQLMRQWVERFQIPLMVGLLCLLLTLG